MQRTEKETSVAELTGRIQANNIAILTKYQGLNVAQATELRRKLRENDVTFKVYKNTLAKIALTQLGLEQAAQYMEGPTAWAFCDDPVAPAKVLKEFGKTAEFVSMSGGILDGQVMPPEKLQQLAELPSQEELIAQVVGTVAQPLRSLVGAVNALPRNLASVIDEIRKQKEEAGEAA
ncbi:MAG: 50S ribosomal protein L10 [Candidatus Hydrogenedentota bacterium]